MPRPFDREPRQALPIGRALPTVIDCVPKIMLKAATSGFQTTRWTLIKVAAASPTTDSRDALATLCQTYWHPVYAFIRRKGHDPETIPGPYPGFLHAVGGKELSARRRSVNGADSARSCWLR